MRSLNWIILLAFVFMAPLAMAQEQEFWEEESWEEESFEEAEPSEEGALDLFAEEAKEEPEGPKVNFVNTCENRNELRDATKEQLQPYKYCNSKTTMLTFRKYPQRHEVVVPIFYEEEHLLVFNTEGLEQDIIIKVYDKPSTSKKRKLIFEATKGEKLTLLELPKDFKGNKLFIDYIIPSYQGDESITSKGCVVFMMGFLDEKFMDLKEAAGN